MYTLTSTIIFLILTVTLKVNVFFDRSSFFTVHRDLEREQNMITENRQEHRSCSGDKIARITGLEICGELQYPNASLVANAPYFPLTGPVKAGITLLKRDSLSGYKFEARSIHVSRHSRYVHSLYFEPRLRHLYGVPTCPLVRHFSLVTSVEKGR